MTMRFVLALALLAVPTALQAQDYTEQMLQSAQQMRDTAEQLAGQLPAEDIAEMIRSAEEIEANARAGMYRGEGGSATSADWTGNDPATRLTNEHGRVDWLMGEPACVGYQWENYRTFRLQSGDRDAERDQLCQAAFGHYESWFIAKRDGAGGPEVDRELEAYDEAAKAAVAFYNGE